MDPRYYSVDVYNGTSRLEHVRPLVVIDWRPDEAESTRKKLNAILWSIARLNRALGSDLREYSLRGFDVDNRGVRVEAWPSWTWHYQPTTVELENEGWWRL